MGFVQTTEPLQKKKCPHKHRGYIVAGALFAWLSWSIQTNHQTPTIDRTEHPQEPQAVHNTAPPGTVKLNVGGTIFETTWATLLKCDDSLFHTLRDSNDDRNVFVDWSPIHTERVLMYLRSGYLNRHGLFWWEDDELTRTLSFLKIDAAKCPFTGALEEPKEYDFDNDGVPMTKKPYVCMYGAPGCEGYTLPEQYKPRRPAAKVNSKKNKYRN
ncbi:hypothetical protein THRCLA_01416 [Thraustotheca clavata]|uniref:Potassium channel tetramerisation-type BTB domain-containing protein n=1 Tax=Thraustotheca clavata TaxID=74557 RepID=A0A1W0A8Q3_9STRA|nr:hypothetical protein THRCLA_01416 [Thraustotheca clavata]